MAKPVRWMCTTTRCCRWATCPWSIPYIVDNLGEALTAKRRGRAVLVSHRTPVFAPAGFEARMAHMHEAMHEWETVDEGPTRRALEKQLVAQFVAAPVAPRPGLERRAHRGRLQRLS